MTQAIANLFFVDVPVSEELHELTPDFLAMVHSFNAKNGNVLGFDFPDWEPSVMALVGHTCVIRVLGPQESLAEYFGQMKVKRFVSLVGKVQSPERVPADGCVFAALTRDNRCDRFKPSYGRRQARRAMARGDTAPETTARPASDLSVPFNSTSTAQSFKLIVKKCFTSPSSVVEFNSYGLCKLGAIPQF